MRQDADRTEEDSGRAGSGASISTDGALGEAWARRYVEVTFGAEGKQRMLKMVDALEKSLDKDIQGVDWMTRHQEAGQGQAAGDPQQDRISR